LEGLRLKGRASWRRALRKELGWPEGKGLGLFRIIGFNGDWLRKGFLNWFGVSFSFFPKGIRGV